MPVESMNEMERTPYSAPESLRVRCPSCRKLYLVQYADIQESKPRFECVQCRTRFWLSLGEMDLAGEVFGIPAQLKEAPPKPKKLDRKDDVLATMEPCPKCNGMNEVGARECQYCGVLIQKFRASLDFVESIPSHSKTLEMLWKRVISDYGNEALHAEFLRAGQREKNLGYVAAQYAQMFKLMPGDETTAKRIREIQNLGLAMLPPPRTKKISKYIFMPRVWQVPLIGATLLIVVGMAVPIFRNMVGVGAAFLFLAVAMQIQMRKKD